ncbi:hypothetical protein Fmac_011219 [Flemingia macrophylla]|uniref:Uncharacterized protein n=1 Tax=Flemingia macrophylla TaxID=520843 RepID=A0ABD1MLU3_9FABA
MATRLRLKGAKQPPISIRHRALYLLIKIKFGCTLWDSYATKFLSYWKKQNSETTIIILTHARIKQATRNVISLEAGEDDPKCFMEDLDIMLGFTLAFKSSFNDATEVLR